MEITSVRVFRLSSGGKLKALASVTFDQEFVVHQVRVIEGAAGLFVAMPGRRTTAGAYRDLAHPVSAAFRAKLQEAVLAAYREDAEDGKERVRTGTAERG
ncbi:MAG: septation regulator SpoVG [Alicyclobacillaceae bacterium]|nr:septation regulator SpoVG [Alicyclobacillaceae bacterium]